MDVRTAGPKRKNEPISRRLFLFAAAAGFAQAQQSETQPPTVAPPPDAHFDSNVNVVSVLATVHDKQGKIVSNLTQDDFQLSEEGKPQKIRYFSRETDLPLTLGLLVDTSLSQRQVLGEERDASRRFVEKVLREDRDQTFLIHFDHDTELLQDLTSSRATLAHALDDLQIAEEGRPRMGRRGSGYPGATPQTGGPNAGGYPGGGSRHTAGTTLYDAIYLASNDLMRKREGRKALILLTDGVDNGSKTPLTDAIESAQRADTLVYSILFAGEEGPSQPLGGLGGGYGGHHRTGYPRPQESRPDGRKILERISQETGGGFFQVSKKLTVDQIYERIEEELRNQYSLGFTPEEAGTGFHRLALTVRQKGLVVQTRQGYYTR